MGGNMTTDASRIPLLTTESFLEPTTVLEPAWNVDRRLSFYFEAVVEDEDDPNRTMKIRLISDSIYLYVFGCLNSVPIIKPLGAFDRRDGDISYRLAGPCFTMWQTSRDSPYGVIACFATLDKLNQVECHTRKKYILPDESFHDEILYYSVSICQLSGEFIVYGHNRDKIIYEVHLPKYFTLEDSEAHCKYTLSRATYPCCHMYARKAEPTGAAAEDAADEASS
jgi:hypothetical protein